MQKCEDCSGKEQRLAALEKEVPVLAAKIEQNDDRIMKFIYFGGGVLGAYSSIASAIAIFLGLQKMGFIK